MWSLVPVYGPAWQMLWACSVHNPSSISCLQHSTGHQVSCQQQMSNARFLDFKACVHPSKKVSFLMARCRLARAKPHCNCTAVVPSLSREWFTTILSSTPTHQCPSLHACRIVIVLVAVEALVGVAEFYELLSGGIKI